MKLNKKHFFQLHSWIGTRLSILFFIVCFSGTLATLSNEMDWLFISEIRATPGKEFASRNLIAKNIAKAYPEGKITYWMRTDEAYLCDIVYVLNNGKRSYVFANPYTGEIQGSSQITIQRFFRDLHYYLFIPFQVGHFMVLLFGFLLLISLLTALYFYKNWWRKLFELQTGKGKLVLFRSLHRLVGLWSIPFTILFSITGIWYFAERTNLGGLSDEVNPSPPQIYASNEDLETENLGYIVDYDKAIAIANQHIPGLMVGDIVPPSNLRSSIYLTGKSHVPLVRQRANRIYLNPVSYELEHIQRAEDISTNMWLNDIADPLHFGNWGGLVTKIVWFIFGLGISSLIFTGIWITLKRQAQKKKKRKKPVMGIWLYINWSIYLIFMGFLYNTLENSYQVTTKTFLIISSGWLLFIAMSIYIFHFRINQKISQSK